jgi:hypothetical protein
MEPLNVMAARQRHFYGLSAATISSSVALSSVAEEREAMYLSMYM